MFKATRLLIATGITLGMHSIGFSQEKGAKIADLTKSVRIEKPASTILANHSSGVSNTAKDFVNPKVQPGKVNWHLSWEKACDAAKKSKKPVLLFEMMGKLDDQFC